MYSHQPNHDRPRWWRGSHMWEFLQGKLTCHGSSIGDNGENAKRVQGEVVGLEKRFPTWFCKLLHTRCKILPTKNWIGIVRNCFTFFLSKFYVSIKALLKALEKEIGNLMLNSNLLPLMMDSVKTEKPELRVFF